MSRVHSLDLLDEPDTVHAKTGLTVFKTVLVVTFSMVFRGTLL